MKLLNSPGVSPTYPNDKGSPKDIFGSGNMAKRDFFGSYDRGLDFFGLQKKKTRDFFGYCFFASAQINNNVSAIYCL